MRIGIVGGLKRLEPVFARMAEAAGHEVLFHSGATTAGGVRALERLVENSDLVLLLTDVNSHGAVRNARPFLRQGGRSPILLRGRGTARFGALLAALGERHRFTASAAS
jgi:hypothetical protein